MASTLIERLTVPGPGLEKLSIHNTIAWAGEILAGRKTTGDFVTGGDLTAEESQDAAVILTKIATRQYAPDLDIDGNLILVGRWLILGESKGYTVAQLHGLLGLS